MEDGFGQQHQPWSQQTQPPNEQHSTPLPHARSTVPLWLGQSIAGSPSANVPGQWKDVGVQSTAREGLLGSGARYDLSSLMNSLKSTHMYPAMIQLLMQCAPHLIQMNPFNGEMTIDLETADDITFSMLDRSIRMLVMSSREPPPYYYVPEFYSYGTPPWGDFPSQEIPQANPRLSSLFVPLTQADIHEASTVTAPLPIIENSIRTTTTTTTATTSEDLGRPIQVKDEANETASEERPKSPKPFPCKECDEKFLNRFELSKHMRTHTPEKSFACSECGKEFRHTGSLKDHLFIHTGQKPYKCEYEDCTKSFSQASNLRRHKRIHTGDKPYKCSKCGRAFNQSSNLKQHLLGHSAGRY